MKEITRIHLASIPYNIELDAKKQLEQYLRAISNTVDNDEEVMKEVEARIAELIAERGIVKDKVITAKHVEQVKGQLGNANDFFDESNQPLGKAQSRVMRDDVDGQVMGVAAGIAAHWKIDVVWVRIVFILLTVFTFGFFALAYFVVAVIMPVASTPTERLQMKGEQVSPGAIRDEAAYIDQHATQIKKKKALHKNVLRWTRYGAALIGLIAMAIGVAIATPYLAGTYNDYKQTGLTLALRTSIAAFALVAMYIIWWSIAIISLLRKKITKLAGYSLTILAVMGIGTFITLGATNLLSLGINEEQEMQKMQLYSKSRTVDMKVFNGAKKIVVDSENPLTVTYNASEETNVYYGTLYYNTTDFSNPNLSVRKDGDSVYIKLADANAKCLPDVTRCRTSTTLTINGPKLESLFASMGNEIHYTAVQNQPQLSVESRAAGIITLSTAGQIDKVVASLDNEGRLETTGANIREMVLTVKDTLSTAELATLVKVELHLPESCAQTNGMGEVRIKQAGEVTVNDKKYVAGSKYSCGVVRIEDQESN